MKRLKTIGPVTNAAKYAALLILSLVLAVFVVPRVFLAYVPGRLLALSRQQHAEKVLLESHYAPEEISSA